MFKWLLIVLLIILIALGAGFLWMYSRASVPPPPMAPREPQPMGTEPNTTVVVHQAAINSLVAAIFPIEGQGTISRKPLEIAYSWRVQNPRVEITPQGPVFQAEGVVRILGREIKVNAQAKADVRYDSTARELFLELGEIQAHTDEKVLGIPLDRLNLAPSKAEVRLLRKLPLLAQFTVKKPQEVREDVKFSIVGHQIHYEKERVVVDLALRFDRISQYREGQGQPVQRK